jgi:hypothetical protein
MAFERWVGALARWVRLFARWVRAVSEKQLLTAAQVEVARRRGAPLPPPPRGVDLFWQKVYVPIYHRLPWKLRSKVMLAMPGSHRQTWHTPDQVKGPAV